MFQIIVGCIIGNVLTIAIIAGLFYLYLKKHQEQIVSFKSNITEKLNEIEELFDGFSEIKQSIETIKDKLDKIPF